MSDERNEQKNGISPQWRRDKHPTHFTSPDVGAKSDYPVAVKHDQGKPEYHHMPPEAFEMINQVLTFGGRKYSDYNWRAGFTYSRCFNAGMRHLWAWWRGEDLDPESSLPHLAHGICCFIFLLQFFLDGKGTDNRYKGDK